MCGRSWSVWAGVRNGPRDGHGSATKSRSGTGRRRCGPRLKKALREGRILVFIDESGLSQRPHRCRTWAPRGQTPVLQYNFNWKSLSVAAGLTVWNFYFRLYPGAVKKAQVLDFLQALVRHLRLPLLVVWDRLPGAPQSTDSGLHRQSARLDSPRIPPSLRAGTEPRGIHLGSLEATRTAESLPQGLLPTQ